MTVTVHECEMLAYEPKPFELAVGECGTFVHVHEYVVETNAGWWCVALNQPAVALSVMDSGAAV
jgi:hypothetical protein